MQEFNYVSAVEGKLVTRFPSLQQAHAQYIGATRKGKEITWTPDAVIAIPAAEWRKYRREYNQAVDRGSLKARTKAEHSAWIAQRAKADEELAKAATPPKDSSAEGGSPPSGDPEQHQPKSSPSGRTRARKPSGKNGKQGAS